MTSLEALKNRISKLRVNHKIGSRDIANKEILDIAEFLDRWVVKDLERLEKLEKAMEIIIKNKIKPSTFISSIKNYINVYGEKMPFHKAIYLLDLDCNEEEYELLKEVLCDE